MPCYDPPRTENELNRFDDMSKRQFEAVLCGCMRAGMPLDAVDWDDVGVDRGLDLGLGEQAIGFGHDLADVGEIGGHGVLRKGDRWTGQKMVGKGTQMGASGQARRQIF